MQVDEIDVSQKGKAIKVPSIKINDITIFVSGKIIKLASIKDEAWYDAAAIGDPEILIKNLMSNPTKPDIFTFSQKPPEVLPKYGYHMEWDNAAAITITSFDDWWIKKLPQETRKNVRKAEKKGVVVKAANFDDELVKGIVNIYNETPVRQGKPFWHYGKDFDTVKKENSTFLTASDFIGAYHNDELIGFIKQVYVGKAAIMMQILSMSKHQDKRPTNALIAKAVEISEKKGMDYLIYGKYAYGKKTKSPLIEFKLRNGFEMMNIPKYYVPLTIKGKIVLGLKLHHGIRGLIPEKLMYFLIDLRAKMYRKKSPANNPRE